MKLLQEFKEFAVKGNMMDMAIGIIIGASFNQVIDVLVKQVLLPPLSLLSDGINLDNKKFILRETQTNTLGEVSVQEVAIIMSRKNMQVRNWKKNLKALTVSLSHSGEAAWC